MHTTEFKLLMSLALIHHKQTWSNIYMKDMSSLVGTKASRKNQKTVFRVEADERKTFCNTRYLLWARKNGMH